MTIWHDLHTGVVHPWLCDQFGHLNVRNYANMFNEAMFHAYSKSNLAQKECLAHGGHGVAAIVRTSFLHECPLGMLVRTEGALVDASEKTLTYMLRMRDVETGHVHATLETLEVFFNPETRSSMAIPQALRPRIEGQISEPDALPDRQPFPREELNVARWHELHRGVCFPWHKDQWGHMNVRWYAHFFDDAIFHIWSKIGTGWKAMEAQGVHTVTASTTTRFRKEVVPADLFIIEGGVARCGSKSVTYRMRMSHVETGETLAYQDVVEVFFDPNTRASTPMPAEIRTALETELRGA